MNENSEEFDLSNLTGKFKKDDNNNVLGKFKNESDGVGVQDNSSLGTAVSTALFLQECPTLRGTASKVEKKLSRFCVLEMWTILKYEQKCRVLAWFNKLLSTEINDV